MVISNSELRRVLREAADESASMCDPDQHARACDFECAWRDGLSPRIEDYLEDCPELERPVLLRELLFLELELRQMSGEKPAARGILTKVPRV